MASKRIPTLPARARTCGATSIKRTIGDSFAIGFKIEGSDHAAPGNGPAVVEALRGAWPSAKIVWGGRQVDAIIVTFGGAK